MEVKKLKKLLTIFLSIFMLFAVASCSGEDLKTLRENPEIAAEIKENLNFNFTSSTGSIRLYAEKGTASGYYDVFIPTNYKDSVIVVKTAINDSLFESSKLTLKQAIETQRFKSVTVSPLMFNLQGKSLYSTEQTQLLNEVANSNYGLLVKENDVYKYNFGFNDSIELKKVWTNTLSANGLIAAYNKGLTDKLYFEVAYLPLIFERVADGNLCLRTHVLMPLYQAYVYDDKIIVVADNENGYELKDNPVATCSVRTLDYEYDENGKLTGYLAAQKA